MTVVLTAANQAVSAAPQDLIQSAYQEIGTGIPGEPLDILLMNWGLEKLQRLTDRFNAQRELIFAVNFTVFNLIANHAPHTIGPNGDFNVAIRPVKIASARFIFNNQSANPVDSPIKIADKDWWAQLPVKSLLSPVTTHLYYEPKGSLGELNFWPICNINNPVRLELWSSLTQAVDLVTPLGFVQGYWDAVVLSLAVDLWPSVWPKEPLSQALSMQQKEAMRIIEDNNLEPPLIDTDSAMPNSRRGGRPDFNFLTGLRE